MPTNPNAGRKAVSATIVAPCYNEEASIGKFYEAVSEVLTSLGLAYSFVLVDDGSTDKTLHLLNKMANDGAPITVLALSRNFGHQVALTAGLDHAEADIVISMDSDLQHPPATIIEMVAAYEQGADVVYAVRQNDQNRSIFKQWGAKVFYALLKRMTRIEIIPGSVDYRLLSRDAMTVLKSLRETHRYLRGMVPWIGFPRAVVYYEQQARYGGVSNYSWGQLARLAKNGLFSFSTIPLDFITWLGVVMNVLGVAYLVYILAAVFITDNLQTVPGWTSVMIAVLLIGGTQLIALGVLAQYIGMIFEQVKERPLYVLKQKRLYSLEVDEVD